jgi:hypothetical protein
MSETESETTLAAEGAEGAEAAGKAAAPDVDDELVLEGAAKTMREVRGPIDTVRVVLHVWATPESLPILDELLLGIHASGLYAACAGVHCFVAGPDAEAMAPALSYLRRRAGSKVQVEREAPGDTSHERLTLESLHTCVGPSDAVLYMHTKGATAKYMPGGSDYEAKGENVAAWRRAILLECVCNWRMVVEALRMHCEVVGPCFRPAPRPHFRGNFWWARGDYLLTRVPRKIGDGYLDPELEFVLRGSPRIAELDRLPMASYETLQGLP